jgi:hypothetical protein
MYTNFAIVLIGGLILYILLDWLGLLGMSTPNAKPADPEVQFVPTFSNAGQSDDVKASPLVVKHLDEGRSTLLIRQRDRRGIVTGQLLVWSGAKRKKIQDSLYDLGVIKAAEATEEVIGLFIASALDKLYDLRNEGRKRKQEARPQQSIVEVLPQVQLLTDKRAGDQRISFPDVYRGVLTAMGMETIEKGDRKIKSFAISYQTENGQVLQLSGSDLQTALSKAKAKIGDKVEIMKVGKKNMGGGYAPMQLFSAAKIES